jgi:hypothetical protein
MEMVTPWHDQNAGPILLEYDGNMHTVGPSNKLPILEGKRCQHYPATQVGDPFFTNEGPATEIPSLSG